MEKLVKLLLTAVVAGLFLQACNDRPIHFPDAEFKAALLDATRHNIDTNEDGNISISEASAYTGKIDISGSLSEWLGENSKIKDLTGIEHFINISQLYCQYNSISTLDLSHNTKLETIRCSFNRLSSLNVNGNIALKKLCCSYNILPKLDLSSNIALEELRCKYNTLTSLDISNNIALKKLECSKNEITCIKAVSEKHLNTVKKDTSVCNCVEVEIN